MPINCFGCDGRTDDHDPTCRFAGDNQEADDR